MSLKHQQTQFITSEGLVAPTISIAFGAASVVIGSSTTLTFTITNPNPRIALTQISFVDLLPAGLEVSTPPGSVETCNGVITAAAGATSIQYSGGSLAPGASCTITVDVTGTTAGIKSNQTQAITSIESGIGLASNIASLTVTSGTAAAVYIHDSGPGPGLGQDLVIYDPSTPAAPVLLSTTLFLPAVGEYVIMRQRGSLLYTGDTSSNEGLHIFDVSNLAAPTATAQVNGGVAGASDYLALEAAPGVCAFVGIAVNPGFIDVWDCTVPAVPVLLAQPALTGALLNLDVCNGDLVTVEVDALAPPSTITVRVYDDPCGAFTEIGSLNLNPYANVCGFTVGGSFGYLAGIKAGSSTLAIVDFTVPAAPALRGELVLDAGFGIACEQIVKDGNFLYLCYGGTPNFGGGSNRFLIVDVTDPDIPVVVSRTITTPGGPFFYGVAKRPGVDVLWLLRTGGAPASALVAYDVSAPAAPVLLSATAIASNSHALLAVN